MPQDVVITKSSFSAEDFKASILAQLESVAEKAATESFKPEVAEPRDIWNLYAIGPISLGGPIPTPMPNSQQVIRAGENVIVATIMIVRRDIASLNLPYKLDYSTGNLDTWTKEPTYSAMQDGSLAGTPFPPNTDYVFTVDIFRFTASATGCFEMNICAVLTSCTGEPSDFAGFVRVVDKVDNDFPIPGIPFEPRTTVDTGIRFMVYPTP